MSIKTQTLFPVPFANNAGGTYRYTITQTNETDNANKATFDDGFPSVTMQPIEAGGIPMFGQDFNGILYQITAAIRELQSGNVPSYNEEFAKSIGGYAINSVITGSDGKFYQAIKDSVTTNPVNDKSNWKLWLDFLPLSGGTLSGDLTAQNIKANTSLTVGSAKATYSATGLNFDKPLLINGASVLKVGDYNIGNTSTTLTTFTSLSQLSGMACGEYKLGVNESANIFPNNNYNYVYKFGARNRDGGGAFLLKSYNSDTLHVGYNLTSSSDVVWREIITTANVSSYQGLGYGQTWQDVLSNRQYNTVYMNSTGKPIAIAVSTPFGDGGSDYYIYVDDLAIASSSTHDGYSQGNMIFGIIPVGSSYKVTSSRGRGLRTWNELR